MIVAEPERCPHVAEFWDVEVHAWRCKACGTIPFVVDQISERVEERTVPDMQPVDDLEQIRSRIKRVAG